MAEFQWWLLIVGLVTGGVIVAIVTMDTSRRDVDVPDAERAAEASFIAAQLAADGRPLDREAVASVLEAHRAYLGLLPPDAIVPVEDGWAPQPARAELAGPDLAGADQPSAGDRHPDDEPDDVGYGRS